MLCNMFKFVIEATVNKIMMFWFKLHDIPIKYV